MEFSVEKIERVVYSKNSIRIGYALFFAGIAFCVTFLLPSFREAVIHFAEDFIVHRALNNDRWSHRFFRAGFLGVFFAAIAAAYLISLEKEFQKKLSVVFFGLIILLAIVFISVYNYTYGHYWIDSDSSSELLGGKVLSGENSLFSSKWYYGTEFWFIYRQPMTVLLFKLTDNWPLIRAINTFFQLLFLILAYIFMMKQTKAETKYILFSACFLVVPLSYPYWRDILFDAYYNLFFVKVFLLMGCFLAPLNLGAVNKRAYAAVFVLLGLLSGLDGIRILYNYFLPLVLSVLALSYLGYIENKGQAVRLSIFGCMAAFIGYFINITILTKIFYFHDFEYASFDAWGTGFFTKLSGIIFDAYLPFFGYKESLIMKLQGILSGLGFLFFVATIIASIRIVREVYKKEKGLFFGKFKQSPVECFLLFYFVVSAIFNMVFFQFVLSGIAARYVFAALIFLFPSICLFLTYFSQKLKPLYFTLLFIGFSTFLFGYGFSIFYENSKPEANSNATRQGYVDFLLENSLEYGFASFWNANVTTELSGGKIDMVALSDTNGNPAVDLHRYKWLSPTKFDDPHYHSGNAFLLLSRPEWEARKNTALFSDRSLAYIDNDYAIIIYQQAADAYNEIISEPVEQEP